MAASIPLGIDLGVNVNVNEDEDGDGDEEPCYDCTCRALEDRRSAPPMLDIVAASIPLTVNADSIPSTINAAPIPLAINASCHLGCYSIDQCHCCYK